MSKQLARRQSSEEAFGSYVATITVIQRWLVSEEIRTLTERRARFHFRFTSISKLQFDHLAVIDELFKRTSRSFLVHVDRV